MGHQAGNPQSLYSHKKQHQLYWYFRIYDAGLSSNYG